MLATNVTRHILEDAAHAVGVTLQDYQDQSRPTGKPRHRFRLKPVTTRTPSGRVAVNGRGPYTALRSRWGKDRMINAVCWHGHREFYRELFRRAPDAVVTTKLARYTAATFESVFPATGGTNIGSRMEPQRLDHACRCAEDGDRGHALQTATIRVLKHSDIRRCPFVILIPDHYRADGTCKCDDATERARMIREWGYTPAAFERVGLV